MTIENTITTMSGSCELCKAESELKQSHIIPKFIYKWKKKRNTGYFRSTQNPNRRIQDGIKPHLLCEVCEQIIGKWEKQFAEKVFKPYHEKSISGFDHSDWLLKFAVSVSWRALSYVKMNNGLSHLSEIQTTLANQALETWRKYILGKESTIGPFTQHLLPLTYVKKAPGNGKLSPYLNRYIGTTTDIDVFRSEDTCLVYSKLDKLVVVGVVEQPSLDFFEGSQIESISERFNCELVQLPGDMFHYLNYRADKYAEEVSNISAKQWSSIEQVYESKMDTLVDSEMIRATDMDFATSGKDAFNVMGTSKNTSKTPNNREDK